MWLQQYKAKRDFKKTQEPAGRLHEPRTRKEPFFVVQKHAATRLHYDFRLEAGGVLKSWAVPKGFPTKRGDRRLAVQVEDHPIEYADFEGTIPPGNYGAGTVMVWDVGAYKLLGGTPEEALRLGKLHMLLRGKKLKGEWTLVRMRTREGDDPGKPQWLLLKSDADVPDFGSKAENRSVLTDRTLEQIAQDNDRQWGSNRAGTPEKPTSKVRRSQKAPAETKSRLDPTVSGKLDDLPSGNIEFIQPMKAFPSEKLPKGSRWVFEIKFDGVRALALKSEKSVSLISRNEKDLTVKYRAIADVLSAADYDKFILDGEIVAVDEQGRPSFQLLQSYHTTVCKPPLLFYVFDILNLSGKSLLKLPLFERKAILETVMRSFKPPVLYSAPINAESERVLREMQARGLEGLIAKVKDSAYEAGRRSGAWLKYKWTLEQEFVIGGFTPPQGARAYFGSLILGYYLGGKFVFAGKVGAGFDHKTLSSLHRTLRTLKTPECPFEGMKARRGTARGGLTPAQFRSATWVRPELVCQVRFAEWTRDEQLRQPAFLGLREDKDPREVVREAFAA